jgi:glutamate dehydrogenase/leucine dehydrogenase
MIAVSVPINRSDGSTQAFQRYCVQHHLTLGPIKSGTRLEARVPGDIEPAT